MYAQQITVWSYFLVIVTIDLATTSKTYVAIALEKRINDEKTILHSMFNIYQK